MVIQIIVNHSIKVCRELGMVPLLSTNRFFMNVPNVPLDDSSVEAEARATAGRQAVRVAINEIGEKYPSHCVYSICLEYIDGDLLT